MAVSVLASGCDFLGPPAGSSTEGLDIAHYSYGGFQDPAGDIVDNRSNQNMTFCGRYVARPGAGTGLITTSELSNLNDAGVSVFFICENVDIQSNSAMNGFTSTTAYKQGVSDANTCVANLKSLGVGVWVVYFAIDFDAVDSKDYPNVVSNVTSYFEGIVSVMGVTNTGLYGSGYIWQSLSFIDGPLAGKAYFWQTESTSFNGNGAYVAGQNLWQWPGKEGDSGYPPDGAPVIGGAAVDGDVAFDVYGDGFFGQYPKPKTTIGILNKISVAAPSMHYSQPAIETVVVPKYKYDQVVFADSFTTTQTSSTWPISINYPNQGNFPDTLNQYFYPIGNYSASVNGQFVGTNDFGFMFNASASYSYGYYLGNLPPVVVQPYVSSSGQVAFNITYNPPNTGASSTTTIDLTINFGLLKYPGTTTPLALGKAGKSVAYQNAISGIASGIYSTYRRIANEYVVTPSESPNSIAHGLNTIPDLFYWLIDNSGDLEIQPSTWTNIGPLAGRFGLAMDSTYIYYQVDSANQQCNIRTYENI